MVAADVPQPVSTAAHVRSRTASIVISTIRPLVEFKATLLPD